MPHGVSYGFAAVPMSAALQHAATARRRCQASKRHHGTSRHILSMRPLCTSRARCPTSQHGTAQNRKAHNDHDAKQTKRQDGSNTGPERSALLPSSNAASCCSDWQTIRTPQNTTRPRSLSHALPQPTRRERKHHRSSTDTESNSTLNNNLHNVTRHSSSLLSEDRHAKPSAERTRADRRQTRLRAHHSAADARRAQLQTVSASASRRISGPLSLSVATAVVNKPSIRHDAVTQDANQDDQRYSYDDRRRNTCKKQALTSENDHK